MLQRDGMGLDKGVALAAPVLGLYEELRRRALSPT
jgi:hypothetical protein